MRQQLGTQRPKHRTENKLSRASSVPSTSTSGDSNSASPGPGRDERGIHLERLPLLRKGTDFAPRVPKIRKKGTCQVKSTPGAQVEDFIPWVSPDPSRPSASEEEEEMTGLLDRYAARKQKRQENAEREVDGAEGRTGSPWMGVRRCRQS